MNPFRYERASDASSAIVLLAQEPKGVFLAGGTNLVDHLRLGVRQPDLLIDITHLPYDRIESLPDGGVRIGALVRNSDSFPLCGSGGDRFARPVFGRPTAKTSALPGT